MSYKTYTYALAAGSGGLFSFGTPVSGSTFVAEAECWVQTLPVQVNNTIPTAPVATPAPAANTAVAGWLHLRANDAITIGDAGGGADMLYVLVWAIGTGYLQIIPSRF